MRMINGRKQLLLTIEYKTARARVCVCVCVCTCVCVRETVSERLCQQAFVKKVKLRLRNIFDKKRIVF